MTLTLHKSQRLTVLVSCSDELAVHICSFICLQRQVVKLASGLFYRWSLLQNNNMATNLHRFTSSYGSSRFATCDCWTQTSWQVMQGDRAASTWYFLGGNDCNLLFYLTTHPLHFFGGYVVSPNNSGDFKLFLKIWGRGCNYPVVRRGWGPAARQWLLRVVAM